jgi:hypothetical protein
MRDLLLENLLTRYAEAFPEHPAWEDVLDRASGSRRRLTLVLAVALAAIVVPSALALSGVTGLFEGSQPPASVTRGLIRSNDQDRQSLGVIPESGVLRPVDSSSTHGVLTVGSLDGPLYLWASKQTASPGECWFATWARVSSRPWAVAVASGCDPARQRRLIAYSYAWQMPHWSVAVLVGRLSVNAATVAVRYGCGQRRVLPVVEHLFMTTFVWSTRILSITALDRSGRVLATQLLPWRPSPGGPTSPNIGIPCTTRIGKG